MQDNSITGQMNNRKRKDRNDDEDYQDRRVKGRTSKEVDPVVLFANLLKNGCFIHVILRHEDHTIRCFSIPWLDIYGTDLYEALMKMSSKFSLWYVPCVQFKSQAKLEKYQQYEKLLKSAILGDGEDPLWAKYEVGELHLMDHVAVHTCVLG